MTAGEDNQNGYQFGACWCEEATRMRCRRCCQTSRCADGHVAASRLTRSGTLLTHANGQGKSRKRLEQESLGATGMLWLLLQCGCCYSAGTNIAALLLLGAKRGQKCVFSRANTATFFSTEDFTRQLRPTHWMYRMLQPRMFWMSCCSATANWCQCRLDWRLLWILHLLPVLHRLNGIGFGFGLVCLSLSTSPPRSRSAPLLLLLDIYWSAWPAWAITIYWISQL